MDFRSFAPQKLLLWRRFCILLIVVVAYRRVRLPKLEISAKCFQVWRSSKTFVHPPSFPSPSCPGPATFWWTSNELNNSKGVANFKFQVLLSLWHESELTLTLPCPPPLLPCSLAPFGMHCLGYNSRLTLIRVPQSVALSAMCDKVAYSSKVAQLIYLYPRDTCYNDNNNCLRSSFAYSITCSCCCSPTRSVAVVLSVACVVIFPTTHSL